MPLVPPLIRGERGGGGKGGRGRGGERGKGERITPTNLPRACFYSPFLFRSIESCRIGSEKTVGFEENLYFPTKAETICMLCCIRGAKAPRCLGTLQSTIFKGADRRELVCKKGDRKYNFLEKTQNTRPSKST